MFRKQRLQFRKNCGYLGIVHRRSLLTQLPDAIFDEGDLHNSEEAILGDPYGQYRRFGSSGDVLVEKSLSGGDCRERSLRTKRLRTIAPLPNTRFTVDAFEMPGSNL